MYKKIKNFVRVCFIGAVWSILYFSTVYIVLKALWGFDITSKRYWNIILRWWDEGGVFDSFQEYTFLITLLAILPLWIWGWEKACRISIVKVLFFPVFWYNSWQERKYSQMPKSITLKNMGGGVAKQSPQQIMEEMIASRMPQEKDKKDLNSNKIRSNFEEKNRSFHKKLDQ